MKIQDTKVKGKLWVQVLDKLPKYEPQFLGRLCFSVQDNNLFIATTKEWYPCAISDNFIDAKYINWKTVNPKDLKVKYDQKYTNLQSALDDLFEIKSNLSIGKGFKKHSIKADSIDSRSYNGLTSEKIYVEDTHNCFSLNRYSVTIEEALYRLCSRRADGIKLGEHNKFGHFLPLSKTNLQEALESLEKYLVDLSANQIRANFWPFDPNSSECFETTVQEALSKLYSKLKHLKIIELIDVQKDYGKCGQYLKTCSITQDHCCEYDTNVHVRWDYVDAAEVKCKLIDTEANTIENIPYDTNVQVAIDYLLKRINRNSKNIELLKSEVDKLKEEMLKNPILGSAGLTLYVDYTKPVSGNGLTRATAFKNFYDCFETIRTKYASPNGIFRSDVWIPVFKVIATGHSDNPIEPGDWRFQNMNIELNLEKNFIQTGSIWGHSSTLYFSGPGTFKRNGAFYCTSCSLIIDNTLYNKNLNYGLDAGCSCRLRSTNLIINGKLDSHGRTGLEASGSAIHVNGRVVVTGEVYPGEFVNTDFALTGTCILDTSEAGLASSILPANTSTFRIGGELQVRQLQMVNCSMILSESATLRTGGMGQNVNYGIILLSSIIYGNGKVASFGTKTPISKGLMQGNSSVILYGTNQDSWSGNQPWKIEHNSQYAAV